MTARILSYTRAIRAMYGYEKAAYPLVYALLHCRAFGAWLDVI